MFTKKHLKILTSLAIVFMLVLVGTLVGCNKKPQEEKVPTIYKVKFFVDSKEVESQNIVENKYASEPKVVPEKDGYIFKFWSLVEKGDNRPEYDFNSQVKDDLKIFAVFDKIIIPEPQAGYVVEHYTENIDNDEFTLVKTEPFIKTNPDQEYTDAKVSEFEGCIAPTQDSIEQILIDNIENTIVKIYYPRERFKVKFDTNKVTSEPADEKEYKYGQNIIKPEDPSQVGYKFKFWGDNKKAEEASLVPEICKENLSYYAIYEGDEVGYSIKVTLENDEGKFDPKGDVFKAKGKAETGIYHSRITVDPADIQKFENYQETPKPYGYEKVKADGSSVVEFRYYRVTYPVKFNLNGGLSYAIKDSKVKHGFSVAEPQMVPDAPSDVQSFLYWSLTQNGDKYTFEDKITDSAGVTLYAIYGTKVFVGVELQNIEQTDYVLTPEFSYVGYALPDKPVSDSLQPLLINGFEVDTASMPNDIVATDGSTKITLKYNRKTVTVTFDDGKGNITTEQVLYGKHAIKPATDPTPPQDYNKFLYWSISGSKSEFVFDEEVIPNDITIKALYLTSYTIIYNKQNVTLDGDDVETEIGWDFVSTEGPTMFQITKVFEGFTLKGYPMAMVMVMPDGSGKVEINYVRNKYDVTFKNGTEKTVVKVTYEGNAKKPEKDPEPAQEYNKFKGWALEGTNEVVDFANTPIKENIVLIPVFDTSYTVNYKYQTVINGDDYEIKDTKTLWGLAGEKTNLVPEEVEGYVIDFTDVTISDDGTTVVEVKYNKQVINVTYISEGETLGVSKVAYGTLLSKPFNPQVEGKTFKYWVLDGETEAFDFDVVITKTQDFSLNAVYENKPSYIVKHLQQNIDTLTQYDEVTQDQETLYGDTDAQTKAVAKEYAGFTAQAITQGTIAADGSTVVEIKYDRNEYSVFYADTQGTVSQATDKVLYGGKLTKPADPKNTPANRQFAYWSLIENGEEFDFNQPVTKTENFALFAVYHTQYIVEHHKQNLADLSIYDKVASDDQTLWGIANTNTQAAAKEYVGFEAQAITQVDIADDGSTVVIVKYDRNRYIVTFNIGDGTGTFDNQEVVYEAKAEQPTTDPTPATDKRFKHWATVQNGTTAYDFNTPVTDKVTLYAVYEVKYIVQAWLENIDDDDYTHQLADDAEAWGIPGAQTNALSQVQTTGIYSEGCDAPTGENIINVVINEDGTSIAQLKYKRKRYTVAFDENNTTVGGTATITEIQVKHGATIKPEDMPANPTNTGFTFKHWSETQVAAGTTPLPAEFDWNQPIEIDKKLYAVYQ